jgi:hypothetical protein
MLAATPLADFELGAPGGYLPSIWLPTSLTLSNPAPVAHMQPKAPAAALNPHTTEVVLDG